MWHTALVLVYVLVPWGWWFRWGPLRQAVPTTRSGADVLSIALYGGAVTLVCFGLKRPLEELIGKLWSGWRSALRDVVIATAFWLTARYGSRLIIYLARSHTRPRPVPHSISALLISIFLALAAGVAEELVFRGYLQQQFTALCRNPGAGLVIQAALFALFHGYTQPLPTFLQRFFFGLLAGLLAHWRKGLLPGMMGHAWYDVYLEVSRFARLG